MGIIINDELTLNNGLVVTGAYASFSGQPVNVLRPVEYMGENSNGWIATSTYNIWANQDSANRKLPFIQQEFVKTQIDPDESIFPPLYTALKAKYTNTTDA